MMKIAFADTGRRAGGGGGEMLPTVFNQPGASFVLLPAGKKFPPIEKEWQKNGHGFAEACQHRGNVGILAGGDNGGLDQDHPEAFQGLQLPATTLWETRPGRLGFRLRWSDNPAEVLPKFGFKENQAQLFLWKDGAKIGEIKLQRTYQVVPPSYKFINQVTGEDMPPNTGGLRVDYKLLDSSSPAEISLEGLLQDLQKLGINFSEKGKEREKPRLEENAQKLERMAREARSRRAENEEAGAKKYAQAALEYEVQELSDTPEGSRNDRLNLSAFAMGQFVAAGMLSEGEVSRALSKAATYAGLTAGEIEATIQSGLEAGKRYPREIPNTGLGTPNKEDGGDVYVEEINGSGDVTTLLKTFKKWLYIEEDYSIVGPMTGAVANFCPGEPDIIGIVAPSGSTKTETIRSLGETENQFVYPLSSLTEHTFISGHKDARDTIPLLRGRLICIKDLTTILSKKEDIRAQIFADFREIIDGYLRKEFGNGIKKEYTDIHSSILFASTNAIERYYSMYSNLGQRMIFLRLKNDPKKARKQAEQNRGHQKEMRVEIHAAVMSFLDTMIKKAEDGLPRTPDSIRDEMGQFYDFLAIARTQIHHSQYTGVIDEIPESEFPTRIANTVSRMMEVHALFYGRSEVGEEDCAFGKRVVLDNIPTTRLQVLKAISTTWETAGQIATKADMPTPAVKYILDELVALKLVQRLAREDKEDGQDKRADSYKIPEDTSALLEKLTPRIRGEHTVENEPDIPPIEPTFEFGEEKSITCNPNDALSSNPWCQSGRRERQGNEPAERDLKEALVCRRVNKALAEGITDPVALSSFCDLPVCLLSRFPGVSKISSERIRSQLESHRREQHFRGVIDQRMGAGA